MIEVLHDLMPNCWVHGSTAYIYWIMQDFYGSMAYIGSCRISIINSTSWLLLYPAKEPWLVDFKATYQGSRAQESSKPEVNLSVSTKHAKAGCGLFEVYASIAI